MKAFDTRFNGCCGFEVHAVTPQYRFCYTPPMNLQDATDNQIEAVRNLAFSAPVSHVYNPLEYARRGWNRYVELYGAPSKEIILLGMNPGPYGMAQTGVPFGDVPSVRDWLGIETTVDKPTVEHPKRPVQGFDCPRREVSGTRLWGWARDRFQTPERFFERFFVANYCPLCFMEKTGRNRTPDKLPSVERDALFAACDAALVAMATVLRPRYVLGIGKFAEDRARAALAGMDVVFGRLPHPSPASPVANRGWAEAADKAFADQGVSLP